MHIGPIISPQPQNIVVVTDKFEYMGLYKNSTHLAEVYDTYCSFSLNGRDWALVNGDYELLVVGQELGSKQPIKSDGGSSSYYTIPLPNDVIDKIVKNRAIETEDILKYGLGNDFDFANAAKSLIRLWGTVNGAGKAGNDAKYELSKIRYSLNKIEKFFVNK